MSLNPYAVAVRATELIELRDRIERVCWGVADGSIKPDAAADLILARMIRDTPAEERSA